MLHCHMGYYFWHSPTPFLLSIGCLKTYGDLTYLIIQAFLIYLNISILRKIINDAISRPSHTRQPPIYTDYHFLELSSLPECFNLILDLSEFNCMLFWLLYYRRNDSFI